MAPDLTLHHRNIGFAEQCELGHDADSLHLIRASGRGARIDVPTGWLSIWLPLSGTLRLQSGESEWQIGPRHSQVWRDGHLRCSAALPCWWIGLAAPLPAWSRAIHAMAPQRDIEIFSRDAAAPRVLRRLLVRLLRHAKSGDTHTNAQAVLEALCAAVVEQQRDLHQRLQRCSGRTLRRRQQTLSRLLRVQHLIRHSGEERLDVARLARSANYSPCHLIRLYREVFDETPSEYAVRLREQRAWQLVRDTTMPVCEITEVLGFESQSAFCRAFKNTFGMTTSELRRRTVFESARAA